MSCKWKECTLGDLITFQRGHDLPKNKMTDGKYPVVGSNGIIGYHNEYTTESPSITIGRSGNVGNPFIFYGRTWSHNTTLYVKDFKGNDPVFVFYFLKTLDLVNYSGGSAVPTLNRNHIHTLPIKVPESAEIQKKIGYYLRLLDEKIAINRAINDNLQQQAQAIFKSWFVDFEPFSNQKPSDWSVSTLGNVSTMGAGGDKPQNVSQTKTDLYQYPIYSNGLSDEGLYGFTDKAKISEESVTVSARGTIGFVCLRHIPYVPIVRLITLIPNKEFISAKYLYLWLKQLHITGTGTTQQQLTVPDFQKTEIIVPSQEIVTRFTTTVEPIFEKIWANQSENEKLSSLRDTLLPKLMSGELDVSDIDL